MVRKIKKNGIFYSVKVIEKSLIHHVIEWVATLLSALGGLLNAHLINIAQFDSYLLSFYVWIVADILWILFALKHKHWGVFTTFVLFGIINIFAILNYMR